jgi:hypothetical protein
VSLTDPYNPLPRGIGQFIIGESPIGTPPFEWQKTVISEYANSPRLLSIIESFADAMNMSRNLDAFFDNVWNIDTAIGYGLDVWGRIVVVSRILNVPPSYLGFTDGSTSSGDPFDVSPFYSGETLTSNFTLSDDAYRQLILAKAAANIWDGSIPGLNNILRLLFPGQVAYCTDGLNMTFTYTFGFVLTPVQAAIVNAVGILPRSTGVLATVVQSL